ncbi:unnamed protein product [Dicrocoelium dendriticum]|nr:unnamed protein product [Dicrocoelium dendriticum]
MSQRHSERFSVEDDPDDEYNPKSEKFCRACVDVSAFVAATSGKKWQKKYPEAGCPLDKPELGRASWSLLHTMAAYYPESATPQEQEAMAGFLRGFALFYPCTLCAHDLRKNMIQHPPKLESRATFNGWLCTQHNLVNKKLNKPLFDCSLVMQRWRHGWKDGSCDLPDID